MYFVVIKLYKEMNSNIALYFSNHITFFKSNHEHNTSFTVNNNLVPTLFKRSKSQSSFISRTSRINGRETPKAWAKMSRPFISFLNLFYLFKHFLIELGCWNFGCRLGPPFYMGLFKFFLNWSPTLMGGLKPLQKSPIFKHFLIQLECWNFCCRLKPPFCIKIFRFF